MSPSLPPTAQYLLRSSHTALIAPSIHVCSSASAILLRNVINHTSKTSTIKWTGQRRNFWWACRNYSWYSYLHPTSSKYIQARDKIFQYRYLEALRRKNTDVDRDGYHRSGRVTLSWPKAYHNVDRNIDVSPAKLWLDVFRLYGILAPSTPDLKLLQETAKELTEIVGQDQNALSSAMNELARVWGTPRFTKFASRFSLKRYHAHMEGQNKMKDQPPRGGTHARSTAVPVTSEEQDFIFDPISMRKVPVSNSNQDVVGNPSASRPEDAAMVGTADRSQPHAKNAIVDTPVKKSQNSEPVAETNSSTVRVPALKSSGAIEVPDDADSRAEDLDLLRTSDVRASSGICRPKRGETHEEKVRQRCRLEDHYSALESRHTGLNDQANSLFNSQEPQDSAEQIRSKYRTRLERHQDRLTTSLERSSQEPRSEARLKRSHEHTQAARASEAAEEQRVHMEEVSRGEGDMSGNIATWTTKSPLHGLSDPKGLKKHAQNERERALAREVRDIYEDGYGAIDSNHCQPSKSRWEQNDAMESSHRKFEASTPVAEVKEPSSSSNSTPPPTSVQVPDSKDSAPQPVTYKILALDPSTMEISTAISTSTSASQANLSAQEKVVSTPEVLLSLNSPARFLPYFATLQAEGFELIHGSGDVVVFKHMQSATPPSTPEIKIPATTAPASKAADPVQDATTSLKSAPKLPTGAPGTLNGFPSEKVSRQEKVFSGNRKWQNPSSHAKMPKRSRARTIVRAVFFGAVWLTGLSYATGVVAEYFKTGGSDGKGPQGF